MHTIVVISEDKIADEKLMKRLHHLFPECRIRVVRRPAQNEMTNRETRDATFSHYVENTE